MSFDIKDYLEKKKDLKMTEKKPIVDAPLFSMGEELPLVVNATIPDRKIIEDFVIATAPEKMTMREFRELVSLVEDAYYRARQ